MSNDNVVLANLLNPDFQAALMKLLQAAHRPTISRLLGKIEKKIKEEAQEFDKVRLARVKELSKKDENGEAIVVEEGDNQRYDLDEDAMRCLNMDISELLSAEVGEMPKPINLSEISVNLTPLEVDLLVDGGVLKED
jgi:hypothetical protein